MAAAVATLLVLSGLLSPCSCRSGQYHYVSQKLSWTEAQKYCRAYYSDLAAIESQKDHTRFMSHVSSSTVWIGLYSDTNDWRWSLDGSSLGAKDFSEWTTGAPDNVRKDLFRLCVLLAGGAWKDKGCDIQCPFLCYNAANQNKPNNYVLVTQPKSWGDAQKYCRQHYTDLASARNQEENKQLADLASGYTEVWFGLFRDTWKWSDHTKFTYYNWRTSTPNIVGDSVSCATYKNGLWEDERCGTLHDFMCQTVTHRQMVNVTIKSNSPLNTSDPAVQANITEQVLQKLQAEGQRVTQVTWRQQPDGKILQEKTTKDVQKKRKKRDEL